MKLNRYNNIDGLRKCSDIWNCNEKTPYYCKRSVCKNKRGTTNLSTKCNERN